MVLYAVVYPNFFYREPVEPSQVHAFTETFVDGDLEPIQVRPHMAVKRDKTRQGKGKPKILNNSQGHKKIHYVTSVPAAHESESLPRTEPRRATHQRG